MLIYLWHNMVIERGIIELQGIRIFKDEESKKNFLYLSPILFILFFVPLILYVKKIIIPEYVMKVWNDDKNVYYDIFSYYKSYFLIGASFIAIILFFMRIKTEEFYIRKSKFYIPTIVYISLVIISSVLSDYTNISLIGFIERNEGAIVLISYMIILSVTYNFFLNEKEINLALMFLIVSSSILGILGIFQFLNFDPILQTKIGKNIIIPRKLDTLINNIDISQNHNIYMTFTHSNYVGSYTAMVFPISFVMFLSSKNKKSNIFFGLYSCLMFANLIGCSSRAGILGGAIGIILVVFLLRKNLKNYNLRLLTIIPFYIIIVLFMNIYSQNDLFLKLNTFSPQVETSVMESGKANIEDIKIESNRVYIITSSETLIVGFNNKNMLLYDGLNMPLKIHTDSNGKTVIDNSKYKRYSIDYKKDSNVININIDNMIINLYKDGTNVGIIYNNKVYSSFDYPKYIGFKGHETFASSRGYIWSRTLPMLKHTILKGYGPDTYIFYFPQYDFIGKLKAYNTDNIVVDKPHSLYLQVAVNTGIISLLALLSIFCAYSLKSIKIYSKQGDMNSISYLGIALFAAVTGYLTAGFFNDSVVAVAPIFWILLGMGISCNYLVEGNSKII